VSFKTALSLFQKIPLSSFPSQKPLSPLVAAAKSSIYRRRGSGDVAAHREQGSGLLVGWAVSAAGKARLPWFVVIQGRGALATCRKRNSVKTTLFNFIFIFLYFFLWGPKNGLQQRGSEQPQFSLAKVREAAAVPRDRCRFCF
jgi:hypothetical protein